MAGRQRKKSRRRRRRQPSASPMIAIAVVLLVILAGGGVFVLLFLRAEKKSTQHFVQGITPTQQTEDTQQTPMWALAQEENSAQAQTEDTTEEAQTEEDPYGEEVRGIVAAMTLEEKVAQMFFVTPEAITGYALVTQCGDVTRAALDRYPVGGLIFLAKNLEGPEQTRQMLTQITEHVTRNGGLPVFLGLDEEGGRVLRIGSNPAFMVERTPAMMEVAKGGEGEVYSTAYAIGTYLHDLGFNLDLAPVADILTNPANDVIGDRAFSSDPQTVARMAAEYANALAANGIVAVYKHFPGHGDTYEDSHNDYAYSYKSLEELREAELIPFIDGAQRDIPMIMVAHISLPEVTQENIPSTLSYEIVTGILREEIGYEGVVITDALDMGAISNHYTPAQSAVLSVQAGCDMLLMAGNFDAAYEALLEAVRSGEISEERIDASVLRIVALKKNLM